MHSGFDALMNLPQDYKKRIVNLLHGDADAYFASLDCSPVRALNVNENKISCKDFKEFCGFPIKSLEFAENCFLIDCALKVGKMPFHHGGAFYVQEPGAMLPVLAADLLEDDKVLDLCAAPGGKTIQAAAKAQSVLANEIDPKRAMTLAGNVDRLGLKNVIVSNTSPDALEKFYDCYFDAVIVDAPCSGEGMFRKEAAASLCWSEENVLGCAARQKNILLSADKMLKCGGKLIYSTCTFSPEEDERQVEFLVRELGYELMAPAEKTINASVKGIECGNLNPEFMRRVYPHSCIGEGQFFAVLKKTRGGQGKIREAKFSSADKIKCFADFAKRYVDNLPSCITVGNGIICSTVKYPDKLKLLVRGVKAGDVSGERFIPHHNLYTAFGKDFSQKLEVTAEAAEKYLRGEEIPCDSGGFNCVTYHGVPLGGGKASGGCLKNHYPKGLRNL